MSSSARYRSALAPCAILTALTVCGPAKDRSVAGQEPPSAIQAAIDRGRAWLEPQLAAQVERPPGDYPMGRLGLLLAALLKAGLPSDHETVKEALEKLETIPPAETYSVACYLFALDAYWQARYRESLKRSRESQGLTTVRTPEALDVPPPGPIRSKMEELVAWLVRGQGGMWHYHGRGGGDHSNSQFAILGLEIGLQNEIAIPTEVFSAIAEHFVAAHSATDTSQQFTITYKTPGWEGVTTGVSRRVTYMCYLGGWPYRGGEGRTNTMTAAGVSSLLVAKRALERAGEYSGKLAWEVDRKIEAGLGWIAANWKTYVQRYGWVYYGLYSVEKVGDIGGISALGPVDWYQEGARFLLANQRRDGSWESDISTAFALLFLTRATRSHLHTMGPPVLYTRVKEGKDQADDSDLVYVDKVKGFVAARSIFDFLAETRDSSLIPIAEQAIAAYPPHRIHEALTLVARLWTDERDAVSRFSAEAAGKIAGINVKDRAECAKLTEDFRRLRDLERSKAPEPAQLESLVQSSSSPILKRRALDVIDRLGLADAFGSVIECLLDADRDVRRRAHEVLRTWSGQSYPLLELKPGTEASAKAALEAAARPWREWWKTEGLALRAARRAKPLLDRLGEKLDEKATRETVEALVGLGPPAVAPILEAMERGDFRVDLVRALESITGQSAGLRPEDWRRSSRAGPPRSGR